MDYLRRDIDRLTAAALKAKIELDSDAVRWFVAEMIDRNPEEEDPFLDRVSDAVWFGMLAAA